MVVHPLAHCKLFISPASGLGGVALHTGKGAAIVYYAGHDREFCPIISLAGSLADAVGLVVSSGSV